MDQRSTPSMMLPSGSIPTATILCLCCDLGQAITVREG
jgi:hypothetical protein